MSLEDDVEHLQWLSEGGDDQGKRAADTIVRLQAALEQIVAVKLRPGEFYSEALGRCQAIAREAVK